MISPLGWEAEGGTSSFGSEESARALPLSRLAAACSKDQNSKLAFCNYGHFVVPYLLESLIHMFLANFLSVLRNGIKFPQEHID
ncbi:hypothetical protein IEQ34_017217 [Dendrobium chrysotoxum]|uniref:Uncharacterized protein n=1 Tax=Dendrobium chrysotoxum TaxID=161865 RepID=A0AAV7GB19_DENCH|nr:hypothetical protein IEQ34_017217 [Dendrobium chrysotoxum]